MVTPAAPDTDPEGRNAPDRAHRVAAAVAGWQRSLADVGGRNTLLWYQDLPLGSLDLTTAHPSGVSKLLAGRPTTIADLVREPTALAEARRRVRAISEACATVLDQRGLPIGFLALGMATWTVSSTPGSRTPQAPVMLRSVVLRPTGPAGLDYELDLGLEVELNPVLAHYLRLEAGVPVDEDALAVRAAGGHGFDPYPVYAELTRLCADVPGFVVSPRLVVSTFPHSKLDMVADLAAQQDRLSGHDVVAALAGDAGARAQLRRTTPDPPSDPDRDPASELLVLDADSGQGDVVDAVRRGASLAVEAPPGAGTTQTVANLVAALAAEGRSVLLVSSDRRDLTEAVDRLGRVGLADLVLDATWAGVDRRRTLQQVVDTFKAVVERDPARRGSDGSAGPAAAGSAATGGGRSRLTDYRDRLRDHVAALHEVRDPWGVSVHEAQWAIAELGARRPVPASRVRLQGDALLALPRTRLDELAHDLTAAARAGAWSADDTQDPWYAAHVVTEEEADRARDIVARLSGGGLAAVTSTLDVILEESSLPPARTALDWGRALTTMAGVRATLEVFRPEIFDNPLDEHVAATATGEARREGGVELGAWARSRVRSQARRLLRPGRPPADLHAELVAARRHRQAWHELVGAGGRPEISPRLEEAERIYAVLRDDLDWLGERLAPTSAGGELMSLPLAGLGARLSELDGRVDRLDILPSVTPIIEELRASGMGAVVDDFAGRSVPATEVTPELELIWWVSLVQHVTQTDPRYGHHDGAQLRRAVEDYVVADRGQLATTAELVRETVDRRVREAVAAHPAAAAALLAEVDGAPRPRRVRDLLAQSGGSVGPGQSGGSAVSDQSGGSGQSGGSAVSAVSGGSAASAASGGSAVSDGSAASGGSAELVLAARPCWAMSPLAVAEVVPVGLVFDVVVIDGAGRLTTSEAVSAISRGRQVVAFGDPGGPMPTSFSTAVVPLSVRRSVSSGSAGSAAQPPSGGSTALAAYGGSGGPGASAGSGASGGSAEPADAADEPRSVYDLLAEALPVRRLSWHYTPRDERLLAQADHAAYGAGWVTFPGTEVDSPVRLERVEGSAFVAAGSQTAIETTEAEVTRVIELVLEHARTRPEESLGVVAVTRAHAARIREVFDDELRHASEAEMAFFDPQVAEPFSVRSIDEVRSARWDSVILTVGYGTTPHGRVLYRFPDLEVPGAARWLRAATARARTRLTVVTSLGADRLDPERLRTPGPVALHTLLHDVGAMAASDEAGRRARDPMMADLADRLRREGLDVTEDVGTSRHTLDLVVHDPREPGRRLVAVEGDGPGYAAMRGTRERDRLWAEHLGSLGWRYVRIWSTDLYRDPAREVARVVAATRSRPAATPTAEPEMAVEPDQPLTPAKRSPDEPATPGPDERATQGPDELAPQGVDETATPNGADVVPTDEALPGDDGPAPRTRRRRRASRGSTAGDITDHEGQTRDDTDAGWGEAAPPSAAQAPHDSWLREQRPPHWGRD